MMTMLSIRAIAAAALVLVPAMVSAQPYVADVKPLVQSSCIACHGARTVTPLNFEELDFDLTNRETFRKWERVFERVEAGEMPPQGAPRPDPAIAEKALGALRGALVDASLAARGPQRTPLRRLTRLEYGYTVQDLLGIDEDVARDLGQMLPAEADSGGFDTVAANQTMSPLHVRSYLDAADRALDAALQVGPRPATETRRIDYTASEYLHMISTGKFLGAGIVKKLDDAYVAFYDTGSTYTLHSASEGYEVPSPGRYRVTLDAYAYQASTPVTLTVYRGKMAGITASLDDLIGVFDLVDEAGRTITLETFMRPGELIAPSVAELLPPVDAPPPNHFAPDQNVDNWMGEGIALRSLTIEGPLFDTWPPQSTRQLLTGVDFDDTGEIRLTKEPYEHVKDIVARFAPLAFRRPLVEGELEAYAGLAVPFLGDGQPFSEAIRVPLRAVLSAPPFLFHAGEAGDLDDFALATRLSYFLWRSMPDAELADLARGGRLTDPEVLSAQVDRMLGDPKSQRFITDYAGQALRLYEIRQTSPDASLYPEYDDRLGQAMRLETELFLKELVYENLGVDHLVDSDFTFVNRRLAEHYGIEGVTGQYMRRVELPADSPRGGILAQASIHKITANGTTTSPVPRGNFVLANLLGTPAPPPPPDVGSLEPDTRGATTIREQLTAHRANPVCASCHRTIDPPGFALESFDPIGGFRANYRISGGMQQFGDFTVPLPFKEGPPVDSSGVTPSGDRFGGILEYKQFLLDHEVEKVARHLASQLLVFSTGAEIAFADRDAVGQIIERLRDEGYPIRSMIHEVVASDLFRRQ